MSCAALQVASGHIPEPIEEEQPDKLSLALEPESAAMFCQNMSQRQLATFCQTDAPYTASCYLIVDIGGGTVDICAHHLMRDPEPHIRVIHPPTGNDCGGSKVNREFEAFLQALVRDNGFSGFVSTPDEEINAKNRACINELVNENFEKQKKVFGEKDNISSGSKLSIKLPYEFLEVYSSDLRQSIAENGESQVQLVGQHLRISYEKMSELFQPVKEGILKCIHDTLENASQIEKIYLVGGFGGCKYIFRAIKEEFGSTNLKYVVPIEPAYAVVKGAVLSKQNPNVIESRKVNATYGIPCASTFVDGLHDCKYRCIDDDGEANCDNLFKTIVEHGDVVGNGEVFFCTFYPFRHNQTGMTIQFYSSEEKDIFYVTGEWGKGSRKPKATVTKIGTIEIQMPDLRGDKRRAVDVTFDFSHTEIQVKVFDRTSKNEVKTVLDFLSIQ